MNILVIEGDGPMRHMLAMLLAGEAVETVSSASTVEEALGVIRDADAILCGEQVPLAKGTDPFRFAWIGLRDTARRLRKHFVLLTADPETRLEALHQDTNAYLTPEQASEAVSGLVYAASQRPERFPRMSGRLVGPAGFEPATNGL